MQTVYPSVNHAHDNCVHGNIYQLHYSLEDLIYMKKIVSDLKAH